MSKPIGACKAERRDSFFGHYEAFRWMRSGRLLSLGHPSGGTDALGHGVSADGSINVGSGPRPSFGTAPTACAAGGRCFSMPTGMNECDRLT